MKLVVITLPHLFRGEAEAIDALFHEGLMRLHMRKTEASEADVRRLIEQINPAFRERVTIHYHHSLAQECNLGGIHLSARSPEVPEGWTGLVSCSCHTLGELQQSTADYKFLSPIYNSISKRGYNAAFTPTELYRAKAEGIINPTVIALGGVDASKAPQIKDWGFGGMAVLGSIWQGADTENIVRNYRQLSQAVNI